MKSRHAPSLEQNMHAEEAQLPKLVQEPCVQTLREEDKGKRK